MINKEAQMPKNKETQELEKVGETAEATAQALETKPAIIEPQPTEIALNTVQGMAAMIAKYAKTLTNDDRAKEFAARISLMTKNQPKIAQAIREQPESFLTAMMACVTLDLMPNTPEQHAFIIPYNSRDGMQVQFQLGYRGLLKLARRSGEVLTIDAELVFEGDEFEVAYGTQRSVIHKPNFEVDRTDYKKVTHAYATAKLSNGERPFVVMTKKELDKIKATARASSTDAPWNTWPERQAIKTVYKRLTQVLPSSAKDESFTRAVQLDSLAEAGRLRISSRGEVEEPEGITEALEAEIAACNTRAELQELLQGLPVAQRKSVAPIISARMKELEP